MTQEDLDQIRTVIIANNQILVERLRAVEQHVVQSIDELRLDLNARFDRIDRRMDSLEARFTVFEFRLTNAVQQCAINELERRVARLERQLNQ